MHPELAVVIISWNTRDLTLDALRTLYEDLAAHGPEAQVWVVDNASTDGSPDAIQREFPVAVLIVSEENQGFAGGNNHALRLMGFDDTPVAPANDTLPRAVYLLNSDTRTHPGATRALYDALFSLPKAGVVGARLSYEDGTFQHSAFRFPGLSQLSIDLLPIPGRLYESRMNGRYAQRLYEGDKPFPVDHTLGATMMLRREAILQTGLFDEQYFMYCEEIDWSWRIRKAGWDIYCVPTARVTHLAGKSTSQVRAQSVVNLWRSRMRLYQKWYSPLKVAVARRIIRRGMTRQIWLAQQRLKVGEISAEACESLVDAYRTVQGL